MRNLWLLLASYFFYMNWEPFYALLILASTVITYVCGILTEKFSDKKKIILTLCIVFNLSILFFFKYYNFVTENIFALLTYCGIRVSFPNIKILLPVGISFYIFQAIGYSVDVYRRNVNAEKDFFTYALFVSFFPQLVAGPIERAKNLLPQFHTLHEFKYENFSQGAKMMLWGYFLKLCVADRTAEYVDSIYNNVALHSSPSLILATFFFSFQIYGDFAGYSLIAKGTACCLGYSLMDNFRRPYLSRNVKEFWKRWHISLSSWFMDYVYISAGGNRVNTVRHLRNLMITFLLSGLWHGADWTFVCWGALHGLYLIIYNVYVKLFLKKVRSQPLTAQSNGLNDLTNKQANGSQTSIVGYNTLNGRRLSLRGILNISFTFLLTASAWVFFRSNNINDAFLVFKRIFTANGDLFTGSLTVILLCVVSLCILVVKSLKDEFRIPLNFMSNKYLAVRILSFVALLSYILLFGALDSHQFIYFQF